MLARESTSLYQGNIHTRNDMPAELLALAAGIGGARTLHAPQETTSETPEVVSFKENSIPPDKAQASPAMTVIGDYMPTIETAEEVFEKLHYSELLGDLMHRARLSRLTGCIMTDYSRNWKGYASTGIKAVRELGLGTTTREMQRVVHFARLAEETGRLPTEEEKAMESDHICRNPPCIYHTRLMDGDENNALMFEARRIEPDILEGRVFSIADRLDEMPWLRFAIAEEGETPSKVISTRLGPFALWIVNSEELVVYGQRIACEAYGHLKPLGKEPYRRKSRRKPKIPKPIKGHTQIFRPTKYKKKQMPTQLELYKAEMKRVRS